MSSLSGRPARILGLGGILFLAITTWTFWYGMDSDKDNIYPVLTQMIPAGHCACETSVVFECSSCLRFLNPPQDRSPPSSWQYEYGRDGKNVGLADDQCEAAFPGQYEDINRGMDYWSQRGKITRRTLDDIHLRNGVTRAMIYGGHLYIIATKSKGEDHRRKTVATLSSIHRALASYPDRRTMPNIEFTFSIEDKANDVSGNDHPLWVIARRAQEQYLWLMPDFGFWARDNIMNDKNNEIGPHDEVVEQAMHVEKGLGFSAKQPKLVWRGKLSFSPELRQALLDQSREHAWSDVKELDWKAQSNYLALEDHCNYQFIAHAEGMYHLTLTLLILRLIPFQVALTQRL